MGPLLDTAPFGFLVARDDGFVETANRTLADMLGTTVDRLVRLVCDIWLEKTATGAKAIAGTASAVVKE